MKIQLNILSTTMLPDPMLEKVARHGMLIDALPFIHTASLIDDTFAEDILALYKHPHTVVFTSAQAVNFLPPASNVRWAIYCIGNATQQAVEQKFPSAAIAGTADNALSLADVIISNGIQEDIIFFCGDQRRNDLPEALQKAAISIKEIVVYSTTLTPLKVDKQYDGILFYSPSAVESYFSVNTISLQTVLFAIGTTTANAIKKYTNNTVITGEKPGKQDLINKLLYYYQAAAK